MNRDRWTAVALLAGWAFFGGARTLISTRSSVLLLVCAGVFALLVRARRLSTGVRRLLVAPSPAAFVVGASVVATAITVFVARSVLHDMVLAIDSSVYVFQARALAHGAFGQPIPPPRLPFAERFLFEGPDGLLYGVFPPGYPLFLAPFVAIGLPMASGAIVSAGLVVASYVAGKVVARDELAARLGVVATLLSFARALETADLMSHGFVACLAIGALALGWRAAEEGRSSDAVLAGAMVGWVFAARLLDGLVVGAFALAPIAIAALRDATRRRLVIVAIAATLPFVGLVAASQARATGSWKTPTQTEYFARSDWPPTCHRLGFGDDVGCRVEHREERKAFGADGYHADDALEVVREQVAAVSSDAFGIAQIAFLAFVAILLRPDRRSLGAAGFALAFALAYGLFYYGVTPWYGARHLFPIVPILGALVGRFFVVSPVPGRGERDAFEGAAIVAIVLAAVVGGAERWRASIGGLGRAQRPRTDLRVLARRERIDRGIVATDDGFGVIEATDTWADGSTRMFVRESAVDQVRRAFPDLPVYAWRSGVFTREQPPPLADELRIELEDAWPSFVRPHGLATRRIDRSGVDVPLGAGQALAVFAASPGTSFDVPLDVVKPGKFRLRVDVVAIESGGTWELALDGAPLASFDAYAERAERRTVDVPEPRALAAGKHVLTARCTGKDAASGGYLAAFDALVGTPVEASR